MGKLVPLALAATLVFSAPADAAAQTPARPTILVEFLASPAAALLTDSELHRAQDVASDEEAASFIEWFWQRRDPVPATRQNEFRAEFQARAAAVAKQFGTNDTSMPGWRTAPGQVYLLLGPPEASYESKDAVFADDAWRNLTVWTYSALPGATYPVRFFFVHGRDGWHLATDGDSREFRDQQAWLAAAREWPIAEVEVSEVAADPSELRYAASAGHVQGGIFANVAVPVTELLGTPVLDGVQYIFDIRLADGEGERRLGVVMARLTMTDLREFGGRDLRLMLWFPDTSPRNDETLRIVEKPSGREIAVVANVANAPATRYAIGKEVAIAELSYGTGVAVTYLAPSKPDAAPAAWLVTTGSEPSAQEDTTPLPGNVFALRREKN